MLARLSTTLSTNVAIAGLVLVVLGAGGTSATLAAGNTPTPKPDKTRGNSDDAKEAAKEKAEKAKEAKERREDNGARPTDTHGFCVSQVAKTAPTEHSGEGADKVTHGTLVSAAAHACGKQAKQARAEAKKSHGKAYGRGHGTGKPAAVNPGSP